MTPFVIVRVLAVALVITMLASCGGDGGGASGTQPLTITADSPPPGTTGQDYPGYTFLASGGAPPFTWKASSSLPPGLTLSASGQLSGTPATASTYAISVTVSDSSVPPLTATAPVSLKINDSSIVIAPATPPAGTVTYTYARFAFSANGGSPPYTWKAEGTLPPGLTLGSDGTVAGTPMQTGSFSFSVTAMDSAQTPNSSPPLATHIDVNTSPKLVLNPTPVPPAGFIGAPYGPFTFSETGGYLPLHWNVTAGALPPGLTLGNDGSLSGTPSPSSAGPSFAFTVTVTDSAPTPVSSSLPFTIGVTLPAPPFINYVEPPTATVGSAYVPLQFTANDGVPPLVWSEAGSLATGLTLSADGVLSGTPTAYGKYPITVNVMDALNRAAQAFPTTVRVSLARPPASFAATGSMTIARSGHTATLLVSGKVLVTGGGNGTADVTAELYDPAIGTFSPTAGNMTEARSGHTATLLRLTNSAAANYGKVLIVGSVDTSAELYDPSTNKFAATGSLHHERTSPTATLLKTGKVLIVGGNTTAGDLTSELYDPASGTFSDTGNTTILRTGHTATLLLDGRVLIAGGGTATAELYNPLSGSFTATVGDMTKSRSGHTATLLQAAADMQYDRGGYVLITGTDGFADLYEPTTETFERAGSLGTLDVFNRFGRTASLRNDGTVLTAGGYSPGSGYCLGVRGTGNSTNISALLAPESDGFTVTARLSTPRDTHTATVLQDGTVLVIGGTYRVYYPGIFIFPSWRPCRATTTVLPTAELYK